MKIVFLDIDGVLNSVRTAFATGGYPHHFSPSDLCKFDPIAVGLMRKLCQLAPCEIVISSTWRLHYSANEIGQALDLPVIGCTPTGQNRLGRKAIRGQEIADWLRDHAEVTHYAIIDDDIDMLPDQQKNFVHIDGTEGLLLAHVLKAAKILETTSLVRSHA